MAPKEGLADTLINWYIDHEEVLGKLQDTKVALFGSVALEYQSGGKAKCQSHSLFALDYINYTYLNC